MRTEAQIKAELEKKMAQTIEQSNKFKGFLSDDIVTRESVIGYFLALRIQSFIEALEWVLEDVSTNHPEKKGVSSRE